VLANGGLRHVAIDRTTDGGKTWSSVVPRGCLLCGAAQLSFIDSLHGFALLGTQSQFRLYTTADGGATWRFVAASPFLGPIRFRNLRHGFGVSWGGDLYRTDDGGLRWRTVSLPARAASLPELFGDTTVVVPVRVRDRLVVYVSEGGGTTWSRRPVPRAGALSAYSLAGTVPFSVATANDWILLLGQTIYATKDGGRSWSISRVRYAPKPPRIWDVHFTSRLTGWAIFSTRTGAALVHTANGGRDWTPLTPPVPRFPAPPPTPKPCAPPCRRP
jgi:photosystem II stability/assembly factor-like uncharacterized protein